MSVALIYFAIGFMAITISNILLVPHHVTLPSPFDILGVQLIIGGAIYMVIGVFKDDKICMCFDCQRWKTGGLLLIAFAIFALIVQFGGTLIQGVF